MCGGGTVLGKVVTGVTNTFTDPRKAVTAAATLGTSAIIEENKKAAASAAAAGAAAFVTSGGNPLAGAVGAAAGAINAGVNKRDIATSAYQSAAYGAGVGGAFSLTGYATAAYKAAQASKVATASKGLSHGILAAEQSTLGLGSSAVSPASYGASSGLGIGDALLKGVSGVGSAIKGVAFKGAELLLPAALLQKLTGQKPGGSEYYEKVFSDYVRDGATVAGVNPQMYPGAAGGGGEEPEGVSVMGQVMPYWVIYGLEGALVVGAVLLWKNRKRLFSGGAVPRVRTA